MDKKPLLAGIVLVGGLLTGFAPGASAVDSGSLKAWGYNGYGQLGDGTTSLSYTPVEVVGLTGVTSVSGGGLHTLALKSDGTTWAWGHNFYGQLGDGTWTDRLTPVQVSGLSDVAAVAGGGIHNVVLKSDGTVWAWGQNFYGEVGDGTTTQKITPVKVGGLSGVIAVACGYAHTIALKSDGTVWAWGLNGGQLGDGTTTNRSVPVRASGLTDVTGVAGGQMHTVAVKSDGTAWTWGSNYYGQLGDGTNTGKTEPVEVTGLSGVMAVACGGNHTVALKLDGTIWTWGRNENGQLGDGTTMESNLPVQVKDPTDATGYLTGVAAVAGGYRMTVALKSDGSVWAWGYHGLFGDPAMSMTPVQVDGVSGAMAIACGYEHTIVLVASGIAASFTQNGKAVTLTAEGFDNGAPLDGKTIKFYRMKYILTSDTWSSWRSAGTAVADVNGTATRTFSSGYGTYRFKAAYEPAGAAVVESEPTADCVIGPVVALTPLTRTVTTDKTPPVTWTAFTGATGYVIQTCTVKTFSDGVSETEYSGVTTGDLPELARGVKTFWRVIAILPRGTSIPSKPWLITYKEATTLSGLDANKDGMTIRPSVTLSGVESGALAGKKVMFYYKSTASTRWLSAGYGITDGGGFAQAAAAKTLPAGSYDLKAVFKGDIEYFSKDVTGSFTLP